MTRLVVLVLLAVPALAQLTIVPAPVDAGAHAYYADVGAYTYWLSTVDQQGTVDRRMSRFTLRDSAGRIDVSITPDGTMLENNGTADANETLQFVMKAFYDNVQSRTDEQMKRYQAVSNHYATILAPVASTQPDTAPAHRADLDWAMRAWERALGVRLWIPRPQLRLGGYGACDVDASAIACAVTNKGIIVFPDIPDDRKGYDYRTILLHEIGHLLGVPHIEDDPLMNGTYTVKLDRPSVAAVALAGLNIPLVLKFEVGR